MLLIFSFNKRKMISEKNTDFLEDTNILNISFNDLMYSIQELNVVVSQYQYWHQA